MPFAIAIVLRWVKLYNDLYKKLRDAEFADDEALRFIGLLAARGPFASVGDAINTLRMLITEHLRTISPIEPKPTCTNSFFCWSDR